MTDTLIAGIDIGGTKCAVVLGIQHDDEVQLLERSQFPTPGTPGEAIPRLIMELEGLLRQYPDHELRGIGISCGGPLDSKAGLILSPPNLPSWDRIDIVTPIRDRFDVPVALQNDANACALAEWMWGAGKGASNLIFLTFGTGMGAGLILNGSLYSGTNDMAGEVGHIRLAPDGPIGYGKAGSFEGFCSGGGIARFAQDEVERWMDSGHVTSLCEQITELETITAKRVAEAARNGDELALDIMRSVGRRLGQGISILVDLLNPEIIIIGSIYARQHSLLEPYAREILEQESLSISRSVCSIVPAGLQDHVGDYASLSIAMYATRHERN